MDDDNEQLKQWLGTRDSELFFTTSEQRTMDDKFDERIDKSVRRWLKLMRDDRRPTKSPPSALAYGVLYFSIFCAASLLLCFVLWVASCTLNAMKGV